MPELSIVIPVYNVAPYLRECLDSLLAQTFTDWEAICVDDGSTDGSGGILDEYGKKVEGRGGCGRRIVVVHQPNQGTAVARQVALEMCQGEWIAAVDPDDWVEPDYFEKLLEATTEGDVDVVWCGFTEERESGAHVVRQETAPDFKTQVLALLDGSLWGGMWLRLFNRRFVMQHQLSFPKTRVTACEDLLFVASALAAGARTKYADTAGYHYRIRSDSSVHQKGSPQTFLSLMAIADRLEMVLRDDWAAEPLRVWRKERLRAPYLDESIPDDVFFAHNGGCKDLWGSRVPFHHKLMYWFAARGWRRFLIRLIALVRKWRSVK